MGILDQDTADAVGVTHVTGLAASDVVLVKLPADLNLFDDDMIALDTIDTIEGDSATLPAPTLVGFVSTTYDIPGAALQVPADAEDGDTYFATIMATPDGELLSNTQLLALTVGDETKACIHWGDPDLWACGGGGAVIWILLLLLIGGGAAAYYFLM